MDCVLLYTIADFLSDDIRTGQIPTNSSTNLTEAEKGIKDKVEFFLNNKRNSFCRLFPQEIREILCGTK